MTDTDTQWPVPQGASEGTAIEQTRAVAEVVAMVKAAKTCPRDPQTAIRSMRESCGLYLVAERAFYRFPRGGKSVTGPTVHLMVELARCWGNITHGLTELRRDVTGGFSEMLAFAWDLEANDRVAHSFIVPHLRDRSDGPQELKELRDVYELTTNQGSRRQREALKKVIPPWFRAEAEDLCRSTLARGADKAKEPVPLPRRIADAIERFDGLGVRVSQLEAKLDQPRTEWTMYDVARLSVSYKAIVAEEVRVEEEFPKIGVTGAEIVAQHAAQAAPDVPPPSLPTGPPEGGWPPGEEPFK